MPEIAGADSELLSAEAVARRLAVRPVTVYRWCRDGRLRCFKLGKTWRIRSEDLDAFVHQGPRPHTLVGYLERFLSVPDQVLTVAEDAALLTQFDAAFFQVGAARDALLIKFFDPRTISRSALQAGLGRHGLDGEALEARGRLLLCPEPTLESSMGSLLQIMREEGGEQPIWVVFEWPSVGDIDVKLRQQETLAKLVATHPHLVVVTGVVEPEPDVWPSLAEQWQLLGSLRGLIRFARTGLLLSRVVKLLVS